MTHALRLKSVKLVFKPFQRVEIRIRLQNDFDQFLSRFGRSPFHVHTTRSKNFWDIEQSNLLKDIVIWLVEAQSVVQSPVRAPDSNFSKVQLF